MDRRRIVNEGRRRLFGAASREIAFVCECGDPACRAAVVLTAAAYDRLRLERPGLVLHRGHAAAA